MKKHIRMYGRTVLALLAVIGMAGGITFAAVSSQASLLGSTLSTTSADLLVWNGTGFSSSAPGFTVENIVPGVGSGDYRFAFKNTGGVATISAQIPSTLKFSGFTSTSVSTAMKYVKVTFRNSATNATTETTLYALSLSSGVALPGTMPASTAADLDALTSPGTYSVKFDVDPAGIGGGRATVDPFDLVFTAKPVTAQ